MPTQKPLNEQRNNKEVAVLGDFIMNLSYISF